MVQSSELVVNSMPARPTDAGRVQRYATLPHTQNARRYAPALLKQRLHTHSSMPGYPREACKPGSLDGHADAPPWVH